MHSCVRFHKYLKLLKTLKMLSVWKICGILKKYVDHIKKSIREVVKKNINYLAGIFHGVLEPSQPSKSKIK